MHIIFLQDDFPPEQGGGAGQAVAALARQFFLRGYKVSVITATQKPNFEGKEEINGIEVYRIYSAYHERWRAWRSLYNPLVVKKVEAIFKKLQPDVVHAHNVHYHLSYASLRAAKKVGARVLLTAHDVMLFHYGKMFSPVTPLKQLAQYRLRYNPLRNVCIRMALRYVDTLIAVSDALKTELNLHGISGSVVIHNAIDVREWEVSENAREEFILRHAMQNRPRILFGGRISRAKGVEVLLLAMKDILVKHPNALLLVAGSENANIRALRTKAAAMHIEESIRYLGWLDGMQLRSAFHAADLVTMPSLCFETFGLVALEAMSVRKPVVASRVGGIPEVVSDGATGILTTPGDVKGLADTAICLLGDKQKAQEMGEAGYNRAAREFSFDTQISKLLSFYETKS